MPLFRDRVRSGHANPPGGTNDQRGEISDRAEKKGQEEDWDHHNVRDPLTLRLPSNMSADQEVERQVMEPSREKRPTGLK